MNEEIQINNDELKQNPEETVQTETPRRIFKTGSSLIAEAPEMRSLSNEEVRALLKSPMPLSAKLRKQMAAFWWNSWHNQGAKVECALNKRSTT
jgi:hypothetical protein